MPTSPTHVVLLRGINVGGSAVIRMEELRQALTHAGLSSVRTYIQSGNVLCRSELSEASVADLVSETIRSTFALDVASVAFDRPRWLSIVRDAPKGWGDQEGYKHNLIACLDPTLVAELCRSDTLYPSERLTPGDQVVYHSLSNEDSTRAQTRSASKAILSMITVRNANTARRLAHMLDP